ncbi:MAG: rod shape-determining protein MreD [Candidatus Zixiibacteriota bacterium]
MFWNNVDYSRIIRGALILFAVVIFLSFFSEPLRVANIKLDFPLFLVVYVGLTRGTREGIVHGFLIGLLVDVLNPSFLGLNTLIKTILGYLTGNFKDNLFLEPIYFKGLIIFLALIANDLIYYLIRSGFDLSATLGIIFFPSILSGIYTSGVGMLVFFISQRFKLRIAFKNGAFKAE